MNASTNSGNTSVVRRDPPQTALGRIFTSRSFAGRSSPRRGAWRLSQTVRSLPGARYGRAAGRIRSDFPGEEPVPRSVRREAERVGIAYPTPAGLTVAQFELLLSPFRAPEAAATLMASLSTDATISLLRAAHELGRGAVVHVAKARLCSLWDDRRLPMAESYQTANLGGIGRHTPSPDDGPRPYTEALAALRAAEEFGLQSVAKRAAYELTCSEDFWTALVTDRASVDISQDVLVGVCDMSTTLHLLWEKALLSPPRMTVIDGRMGTSCHPLLRGTFGRGCVRREGRMRMWGVARDDAPRLAALTRHLGPPAARRLCASGRVGAAAMVLVLHSRVGDGPQAAEGGVVGPSDEHGPRVMPRAPPLVTVRALRLRLWSDGLAMSRSDDLRRLDDLYDMA